MYFKIKKQMKLNEKQQEVIKNINGLNIAIINAIDVICKESSYQITYAEINAALTDTLRNNLGYELKDMWQTNK